MDIDSGERSPNGESVASEVRSSPRGSAAPRDKMRYLHQSEEFTGGRHLSSGPWQAALNTDCQNAQGPSQVKQLPLSSKLQANLHSVKSTKKLVPN